MVNTRYDQAKSPALPEYDVIRPHVNLIYLDASMGGQCLNHCPPNGFRFLQPDEVEKLAPVGELSDDTEDGYT